ncbi:MAG: septum formation inhibitor Maf [Bacteroidota bacterium]
MKQLQLLVILSILIGLTACKQSKDTAKVTAAIENTFLEKEAIVKTPNKKLSKAFKDYWYAGDAEITSYALEQARYGEMRKGKAVLVFVTEPFLPEEQVKADQSSPANIPVLKLNKTKNYLTGIYPYSIMSSTFYPVYDNGHALKSSFSAQEWCGHVYAQLNNRAEQFEFTSHSYFQGEADQELTLNSVLLEDEIWNKIRINPNSLPLGDIVILPSLESVRVQHQQLKAQNAQAALVQEGTTSQYSLKYAETDRQLTITFETAFPHQILEWEETFISGYGTNAKRMVSKATKLKTLKSAYWRQNSNEFLSLRDSLQL